MILICYLIINGFQAGSNCIASSTILLHLKVFVIGKMKGLINRLGDVLFSKHMKIFLVIWHWKALRRISHCWINQYAKFYRNVLIMSMTFQFVLSKQFLEVVLPLLPSYFFQHFVNISYSKLYKRTCLSVTVFSLNVKMWLKPFMLGKLFKMLHIVGLSLIF